MAYGLLPGFDEKLTPTDREHVDPPAACPPGWGRIPVGHQDGYFPVKFSRWIEAWTAMGRLFVDNDLADQFQTFFKPLLNQPQDRVWDVIDAGAFCSQPQPALPTYVDLDTPEKVLNAVNQLVRRRLWGEKCVCQPPQSACLSSVTVAWSWEDENGGSDSGLYVLPPGASGFLGGWTTFTLPELFNQKLLYLTNLCGGSFSAGGPILIAGTSQDETAKFVNVSLTEIPAPGNNAGCLACVPPPGDPPPSEPIPVPAEAPLVIFIPPTPENPCVEITVNLPKGEDVEPAEVPVLRYSGAGVPEVVDVSVNVPSSTDGSTNVLFRTLFEELASIKQVLQDPMFRRRRFYEGGVFLGVRPPGQPGEGEFAYEFGIPRSALVRIEFEGVPQASDAGIRVFSTPGTPPESRTAALGWYTWTVDGESFGPRQELWAARLVLPVPDIGRKVWLRMRVKPGLGYTVWGTSDTNELLKGV